MLMARRVKNPVGTTLTKALEHLCGQVTEAPQSLSIFVGSFELSLDQLYPFILSTMHLRPSYTLQMGNAQVAEHFSSRGSHIKM